jgi:tRNA(His) 5'-end guanylyltransferase
MTHQFHFYLYTQEKRRPYVHKEIYTLMFITALLIIAQTQNNPIVHYPMSEETNVIRPYKGVSFGQKRNTVLTHATR